MSSEVIEKSLAGALAPRPSHVPEDRVVHFDLYDPPGIATGCPLQDSWKSLQADGVPGVVWTPCNEGHWIITRAKLIQKALLDTKSLSNKVIFIPKSAGEEYKFIPSTVDPPVHRHYRVVLNKAIERKVLSSGFEQDVLDCAHALVAGLAPHGGCEFVEDFAQPFPFTILMRLMDLPYRDTAKLKIMADQITRPDGTVTMAEATQMFYYYLDPIIRARKEKPGDDIISTIICDQIEGRALTMEETQNICCVALFAGLDTVVNSLSFIFQYLATHPQQFKQLQDNPDLIPAASEELLRRFPVVTLARIVVKDIEIDGVTLKQGDMVAVPSMLSGIDEEMNTCPMDVDFHRVKPRHMTFGAGIHVCAGAPIARREIVAALRAWTSLGADIRVAPDATVLHQGGIVGAVRALPLVW
jgi:camphor 5-monooxygenase